LNRLLSFFGCVPAAVKFNTAKWYTGKVEEAFELDEKWTKTTPKVGPNGSGFLSKRKVAARIITIDDLSADWLLTKAIASHKTPAEIISDMVQKEIAASA
jgi:hypothetical protein